MHFFPIYFCHHAWVTERHDPPSAEGELGYSLLQDSIYQKTAITILTNHHLVVYYNYD